MAKDDDILSEARDAFTLALEVEADNRVDALDDLEFARLGEQWPREVRVQREKENRPCLTINRMPSFIRQVVNDARQNKPQIKVRPVDSGADMQTAEIINGLIRNIEYTSNADVAYDTAAENAITMGFGYIRVGIEYAHDDTFDRDIVIERVGNPFTVYADPRSQAADSSDWDCAFITELVKKDEFERRYKGAEAVNWDSEGYGNLRDPWITDDSVLVAEYWKRREVEREIHLLSDGTVIDADRYEAAKDVFEAVGITVQQSRTTRSHKVTQYILTGAEVLETNEWAGRYIPIVPVYGDEVNVEGKRYFRSLIRDAKDAQRMFNYWRTTSTELVALAPRAPWVGPKGAFATDAAKWATANTANHPFIEYDGGIAPQRQPFSGVPAGALQEALNASDDMKSIMGLYDASLGARSNETSGRAIMARQREGDVSTFHFIDNLSRAIRHVGRIVLDLIPAVYTGQRIVRVLGQDGSAKTVPLGQPVQQEDGTMRVFDLTAGKYDLTVEAGPSFTTRREEAVAQMTELIRAFPQAAPVLGDILARNLDWPEADEIAARLKALLPPQVQGNDPRVQQAMAQIQALTQQLQSLQADKSMEAQKLQLEAEKVRIDAFKAETDRIKASADIQNQALRSQTEAQAMASPDVYPG